MAQFAEFAKKHGVGFVEYLALRYAAEAVIRAHPETYGEMEDNRVPEDAVQTFFILEIFPDFEKAEKQGEKIDLIDYLTEFFL